MRNHRRINVKQWFLGIWRSVFVPTRPFIGGIQPIDPWPSPDAPELPPVVHEQESVELNGISVNSDIELIPLLKALNDVGLVTRSHCQGGKKDPGHISIMLEHLECVDIWRKSGKKCLTIWWFRPDAIDADDG